MHVAAMSRMRQHAALLQAEGGTEQRGVHLVAVVCREQHAPLLQEREPGAHHVHDPQLTGRKSEGVGGRGDW